MPFLLPIIGFAVAGPWGALVGGFLQQIFFPPEGPKGPRLNELNVQRSTVGAPIPITYGTVALAGNVIWSAGLHEQKHEDEQGGFLGVGGVTSTSYTYSVDVAIGICEGEISGIRRIWADADLIYDASDDATLEERLGLGGVSFDDIAEALLGIRAMSAQLYSTMAVYLGTEDQMPDPTIEGHIGDTSAFRGLAYIVFDGFELAKYGNRIPNFRFEVYTGAATECGIYSAGQLYPWQFQLDSATYDPRNPDNNHVYSYTEGGPTGGPDFTSALAQMESTLGRDMLASGIPQVGQSAYIHGWATGNDPTAVRPCDTSLAIADYVTVTLSLNSLERVEHYCDTGAGAAFNACADTFYGPQHIAHISDGGASGFWVHILAGESIGDYDPTPGWDPAAACGSPSGSSIYKLIDHQLAVTRTIQPPNPCLLGTPLAGAPGWCVVDGVVTQGVTWTEVAGTFKVLQKYTVNTAADPDLVSKYPVGPAVISTDPLYNDQAYWEAAYAQALADGEPIAAGLTYGVDYPVTQTSAYFSECQTVDTECVPMAVIVSDLCRRAGLRTDTATQIDVSGLTTCVNGYVIGRQMSARDALGPLRMFGLWDAVESDALLKFVERGHAIVDTLTSDDLGAHEAGSQAPTAVEASRLQEKDLPRRLRLHFANFEHDHETSEQSASRITTEAVDELDVELPISMTPDTAKQLAEIMLFAQWVGRDTFRFSLDNNWLGLEPTDCVELPVDGQTERVRIVAVNYSIGGICQIEAQRDDDGSYVSTAVATPSQPSGGVPGGPGSGPICPSEVVLLDLPRLNAAHIDAGYYAAIYSTCPEMDSWACAELYRSNDGGVTFGRVARTNEEVTVGEIDSITGPATDPTLPGDSPAYDASNSITVTLFVGELASITDAQIAAGQNMAAIGQDGQWVIIQFKTAVLDTGNTWVLTDLIWGLNDTEHLLGTTSAGDTFVLLSDPALLRIPESADAIGVEKQFKVVTCGEAVDAVDPQSFTTWGLSYLRLCPSTVISCSVTEPPVSPADGDAYYLPNDTSLGGVWATHAGEVAHWSDETDSWVYCTPAAGTIVHCTDEDEDLIPPGGGGTPTPAPWQRVIEWQDEGVSVLGTGDTIDTVNFVGPGVTATLDSSGALEVNIPGGGGFDTSGDVELSLDQLSDVTIGSPLAEGDLLVYRGTEGWVNEPAEDVTGGGGDVSTAYQAADLVITSNNVLQNTDLVIAGLASGVYGIDLFFVVSANSVPDMEVHLNTTATLVTSRCEMAAHTLSGSSIFMAYANQSGSTIGAFTFVTTVGFANVWTATAEISTSGDIRVQARQVTSSGSSVTFHGLSRIAVRRLDGAGGGGGSFVSPLTTKGDLFTFDTDDARLGVGTTGDTVIADSTQTTGLKWGVPGIPSNPQTGNYTIVAADNGRAIDHASGAGAGDTYTIPANGTLALPLGFTFSVSNMDSNALTVAITTDTLRKAGTGSTGSVSVAQYGTATFRKVATTEWLWTGVGAT